jgi:hypothetical protein
MKKILFALTAIYPFFFQFQSASAQPSGTCTAGTEFCEANSLTTTTTSTSTATGTNTNVNTNTNSNSNFVFDLGEVQVRLR